MWSRYLWAWRGSGRGSGRGSERGSGRGCRAWFRAWLQVDGAHLPAGNRFTSSSPLMDYKRCDNVVERVQAASELCGARDGEPRSVNATRRDINDMLL